MIFDEVAFNPMRTLPQTGSLFLLLAFAELAGDPVQPHLPRRFDACASSNDGDRQGCPLVSRGFVLVSVRLPGRSSVLM